MNAQNKVLIAEVKKLQSAKKQQTDRIDGLKKILREMEKEKRKVEEKIGNLSQPIWAQIKEKCFVKFGIDRPYYHGGKCNGNAMVKLLNKTDEVMEAVKNY
jgi:hypothetical protein